MLSHGRFPAMLEKTTNRTVQSVKAVSLRGTHTQKKRQWGTEKMGKSGRGGRVCEEGMKEERSGEKNWVRKRRNDWAAMNTERKGTKTNLSALSVCTVFSLRLSVRKCLACGETTVSFCEFLMSSFTSFPLSLDWGYCLDLRSFAHFLCHIKLIFWNKDH